MTLTKFFELSEMFYKNRMLDNEEQHVKPDILFDTNPLRRDCGFIVSEDPITLIKKTIDYEKNYCVWGNRFIGSAFVRFLVKRCGGVISG